MEQRIIGNVTCDICGETALEIYGYQVGDQTLWLCNACAQANREHAQECSRPAPECPSCAAQKEQADRLAAVLLDVVATACEDSHGEFDSMAISNYAEAIELLAERGLLVVSHSTGRRVIARRA